MGLFSKVVKNYSNRSANADSFKDAMAVAAQKQTDEYAKNLGLSEKYGLPMSVVESDPAPLMKAKMSEGIDLDKYSVNNPRSSNWLSNIDNASISHDDIDNLAKTEESIKDNSVVGDIFNSILSGSSSMLSNMGKSFGLVAPAASRLMGIKNPYEKEQMEVFMDNPMTRYLDDVAKRSAPQELGLSPLTEISKGNLKSASKALTYQIFSNVPQLAFVALNPVAGITAMGAASAGGKFEENLKGGAETGTAMTNALGTGLIEGGIEMVGGIGSAPLKNIIKHYSAQLGEQATKDLIKRGFFDVLSVARKEAGTEGLEEFSTSIAQDLLDYASGVNDKALDGIMLRAADAGLVGAGSGGFTAGAAQSIESGSYVINNFTQDPNVTRAKQAFQNYATMDFLKNLKENADASKVRKRMGEKYKEFINHSVDETPLKEVYIDTEKIDELFQSKKIDPIQEFSEMGILEKYQAAKASGAAMVVDTGTVAEKFTQKDYYEALTNDMKFSADHLSANELSEEEAQRKEAEKLYQQQLADQAIQQDEDLKKAFNQQAALNKDAIRKNIKEQLVATGIHNEKDAGTLAQIYESVFATLEGRYGLDSMKLFQDFAPNIIKGTFEIPDIMKEGAGQDKTVVQKIKDLVKNVTQVSKQEEIKALPTEPPKIERWDNGRIKYDREILKYLRSEIDAGSAGYRGHYRSEKSNDSYSYAVSSTFPEYFKNKGYTKKDALNIIDKESKGKELTDIQRAVLDDLYEGAVTQITNEMYRSEQSKKERKSPGDGSDGGEFTLFSGEKGSYRPTDRIIKLAETADLSTFIHESGHYFFDVVEKIARSGEAPQGLVDDYMMIREYVGAEKDKDLTRDQHEKFAEAFTNYLASGKAPSRGLRRAFETFKNWLLSIYKGLRLDPALSPEIIGVFDRMLATDEEIDAYMNDLMPDVYGPDFIGNKNYEKYVALRPEIKMEAEDQILEKYLSKENREKNQIYKTYEKPIREKYEAAAKEMTVFKVIDEIESERLDKLNREEIEEFGEKFAKEFPKNLMKRGGLTSPEVLAGVYGYENSFEMLKDIAENRSIEEFVDSKTAEEMATAHPELVESFNLTEEVKSAVLNEKRSELLRLELEMLADKAFPVVKGIAKDLIRRAPDKKAVDIQARFIIGDMKTSDIKPHVYRNAEKKFSRLAAKEYGAGDIKAAYEAKKMEYLNHVLNKVSNEVVQMMRKDSQNFKKIVRTKDEDLAGKREMNYVNGARAILSLYGIGKASKSVSDYVEAMKKYDPSTYIAVSQMVDDVQVAAGHYNDIKFDDYRSMRDLVYSLWDLAKTDKEFQVKGEKMKLDEVAQALIADIQKINSEKGPRKYEADKADKWEKFKARRLATRASMKRVEHWAEGISQLMSDYVFKPISEAETRYILKKNEVMKQYEGILQELSPYFKQKGRIVSQELDNQFTREQLLHILLHTGNESNKKKLVIGRGWGNINEDGTLNSERLDNFLARMRKEQVLTKREYDAVQKIWDLMESINDDSQKAHKKIYGYYYGKVKSAPIYTEFGTYAGGYVPARIDYLMAPELQQNRELEKIADSDHYDFPSNSTGKGFTKDRNENYKGPLALNMALLHSHIDSVMRFTYMQSEIKQATKLLQHSEFRKQLNDFDQYAVKEILNPFLRRVASQRVINVSDGAYSKGLDSAAKFLRRNAAIQAMTLNVANALQQTTGTVVAMTKVSPKQMAFSLIDYVKGPRKMSDEISSMSDWYKSEQGRNSMDIASSIRDISLNPNAYEKTVDFVDKNKYIAQTTMQNITNTIVWNAAFNDFMSKHPGAEQEKAVSHADSIVRTTQGTSRASDLAASQIGTEFENLFKQFTGYFNLIYNLRSSEFDKVLRSTGLKKGLGRLTYVHLMSAVIPAVIAGQITQLMSGRAYDEDDDGLEAIDLLKSFFLPYLQLEVAAYPGIFLVNETAAALLNKFSGVPYGEQITNPAFNLLEKSFDTGHEVYKNLVEDVDNAKAITNDSLALLGMLSGLPTTTIYKPIKYIQGQNSGELKEASGLLDYSRGLITGQGEKN